MIKMKKKLIVFGANSSGQLGVGRSSEYEPQTELELAGLCPKFISTGGGSHTLIIDENDELWAAGRNNKGQLGIGSADQNSNIFTRVCVKEKLRKVSCGWDTSAGISLHGRVFLWGSNSHGQLGILKKVDRILEPTELILPFDEKAIDVGFGLKFSAIHTASGNLFIFGSLKCFHDSYLKRVKVGGDEFVYLENIKIFACGLKHLIFYKEKEQIVRGLGENKFSQSTEIQLPEGNVRKLISGWTHNGALMESGELFVWGRNNYGQLGIGKKTEFESEIQKCRIDNIDMVSFGSEHALIVSKNEVYTWGWNEHANCGNQSFDDLLKPEKVVADVEGKIESIAAGCAFCMIVIKQRS